MENQNHHTCDMKVSKIDFNKYTSIRMVLILVYLFERKLSALHMQTIVYYGLAAKKILRRLLSHLKMMAPNRMYSTKEYQEEGRGRTETYLENSCTAFS